MYVNCRVSSHWVIIQDEHTGEAIYTEECVSPPAADSAAAAWLRANRNRAAHVRVSLARTYVQLAKQFR